MLAFMAPNLLCTAPPFIAGAPKVIVAGYGNPGSGTQHPALNRRSAPTGTAAGLTGAAAIRHRNNKKK
jgi:hypothetical protein